jgi:hypothetical protein
MDRPAQAAQQQSIHQSAARHGAMMKMRKLDIAELQRASAA